MERERNYHEGTFDWAKLLGEDVVRTMDEERNREFYQKVMEQKEGRLKPLYRLFDSVDERVEWKDMQGEFCVFYGWFFAVALSYAETFFPKLADVCEDERGVLLHNVYESVKMVPVRCLIREIHYLKERGELEGASPQEEYRFYDKHMLGDIAYVRGICQKYPELLRLMLLKIDWTVRELACIAEAVERDADEIREMFCAGRTFSKVHMITCALSDTHRGGKTVAVVELDNGIRIFYKPRSLQKETEYQGAYEWFGQTLGIEVSRLDMLVRDGYGWEARVGREECGSIEAVGRYFYRLGVQLCLNYLANGSDLHGENVMAMGEFPVIVDMETCSVRERRMEKTRTASGAETRNEGCPVNVTDGEDTGQTVEERDLADAGRAGHVDGEDVGRTAVGAFLQDSVLRTGILPFPAWGSHEDGGSGERDSREGAVGSGERDSRGKGLARGVNVSALHGAGKIHMPFRLPVVVQGGTSDIAIAYRNGELELPDSVPCLDGKPVEPGGYRGKLVKGFVDAYRCALENKDELEAVIRPLWEAGSRHVMRHTQQYGMYLFTSLHPDFMKDAGERIRFFHVLRKGEDASPAREARRGEETAPDSNELCGKEGESLGRQVFWQEVRDLLDMDIPYFSGDGDSVSLLASDGTEIPGFFAESALEAGKRKLERLGEADLQKQVMLISYSLLMLGETKGKARADVAGKTAGRIAPAGMGGDGAGKTAAPGLAGNVRPMMEKMRPVTEERRLEAAGNIARMIWRMRLCGTQSDDAVQTEEGVQADGTRRQETGRTYGTEPMVVWPDLQFYGGANWGVKPLGMNLYDGLPGVALFFAALSERVPENGLDVFISGEEFACDGEGTGRLRNGQEIKAGQIFSWLCGQMFEYTDSRLAATEREAGADEAGRVEMSGQVRSDKSVGVDGNVGCHAATEAGNMGLFVGESSVLNAYLLLWKMKKNPIFLEYAKRQERVVGRCWGAANEKDLLMGDAGCILCYVTLYEELADYEKARETVVEEGAGGKGCTVGRDVHMAREETGTKMTDARRYLDMAVEIGERLWERVEEWETGYGWTIRGEAAPLAGMAHGNSGGILAYAALLERTKNAVYVERIGKLLVYENSLYSDEAGNWRDIRVQHAKGGHGEGEKERNMVAWCHGAGGILLSRLKLYSLPEFQGDEIVRRDIKRAVAALKYGEIPDNICLCHGLAGNYMIIRRYLDVFCDEELEERGELLLSMLICRLEDGEHATDQERNRVGLMCGLAGAGAVLTGEVMNVKGGM